MNELSRPAPLRRVCALYALSGFIALGYQVSWFRIFVDWFGSTSLIFGLVVCAFIGGLGAGALLSRRIAAFVRARTGVADALKIYGLIELSIAAAAVVTLAAGHVPAGLWGSFPYALDNGMWVPEPGYAAAMIGVAILCVVIPCFLMGATFPLLCAAYLGSEGGAALPARLYAWNTFGACGGALACQFLLLPILGHGMMFVVLIGLNILLGAYFVATGGGPGIDGPAPRPAPAVGSAPASAWQMLVPAAILSGAVAGILEGDLAKRAGFLIEVNPGATMPLISFWAILGIFLASALVNRARGLRLGHIKVAFVAAAGIYLATTAWADPLMEFVQRHVGSEPGAAPVFPANNLQLFAFTGALTLPAYFLVSLLLPYACNRLQADRRHLDLAYGLNTVAFCAGILAFSYVAPAVSIFFSLKLAVAAVALGAFATLLLSETRRWSAWALPVAAILVGVLCLVVPRQFDPAYFRAESLPARFPVSAVRSNAATTTFVVDIGANRRLFFGRLSMSGTNFNSQAYMRLMAHFPLLAQTHPLKALLICFGVGNTASAIATHEDLQQIDIVDLNRTVLETAPAFAAFNRRVTEDPRVRLIVDDGRNYLNRTQEKYDLITSEPPPPLAAGIYRLYSEEYYRTALEHMSDHGLMTQWLPVHGMTTATVRQAIATFTKVFPHTLLITGYDTVFVLVGGRSPIDLGEIARQFDRRPGVVADLKRIGVFTADDLVAHVVQTDGQLRAGYREKRLISDLHNDLDHAFLDPRDVIVIPYDPYAVLEDLQAGGYPVSRNLQDILLNLGRLRYHARAFPYQSLATVRADATRPVTLANVDWLQIAAFDDEAKRALSEQRWSDTGHWLDEALRVAPAQPDILLQVAENDERLEHYNAAMDRLTAFIRIEPESAEARYRRAELYGATGRFAEALADMRAAIALDRNWALPLNSAARILATSRDPAIGNPAEAITLAEEAARLSGSSDPVVLDTLAVAYAAAGRGDDARRTIAQAIAINARIPTADGARLRQHEQEIQGQGPET